MKNSMAEGRNAALLESDWRTGVARWLLGLVLSVGGAMVWWWVVQLSVMWVVQQINKGHGEAEWQQIAFQPSGEPFVHFYRGRGPGEPIVEEPDEYRTLDGEPVTLTANELQVAHERVMSLGKLTTGLRFGVSGTSRQWSEAPIPLPWSLRCVLVSDAWRPGMGTARGRWFLVWPDRPAGSAYFVEYDVRTATCLGYLGRNGRSPTVPPIEDQFLAWDANGRDAALVINGSNNFSHPFPPIANLISMLDPDDESAAGLLWLTPDRKQLYAVNLTRHTVSLLRTMPDELLRDVITESKRYDALRRVRTVLRWPNRLEFLASELRDNQIVMLPHELHDLDFRLSELQAGGYVAVYQSQPWRRGARSLDFDLLWFNEQGVVSQRRTFSQPLGDWSHYWEPEHFLSPVSMMPLVLLRLNDQVWRDTVHDENSKPIRRPDEPLTWDTWWKSLRVIVSFNPWRYMLCLFSGVPFAIACWWRLRRFGTSRFERLSWPVLVYVFGLVGWIAFKTHRDWPSQRPNAAA